MPSNYSFFFALWPDEETRTECVRAAGAIMKRLCPTARPMPADGLQMTLMKLSKVPPRQYSAIWDAAAAVRFEPFSFQLGIASSFRRSKAWWLASRDNSLDLVNFRSALRARLEVEGVPVDAGNFSPQVSFVPKAPLILPNTFIQPITWRVSEFALVKARGAARPRTVDILERWPLRV